MKSNNELLRLMNLPVFYDEKELAFLIHVDLGRIKMLSKFSHRYYKKYKIPKSNGNLREIRQPRKDLKGIQAWILRNILDNSALPCMLQLILERKTSQSTYLHIVVTDISYVWTWKNSSRRFRSDE